MAEYSMKEAIDKMLEQSNWKYQYQLMKLENDWELLVGKTIARHTQSLKFSNGILYISTTVAPLKHELSYNKIPLIAKINQHIGDQFVRDIVVS
jgi:predicted nucleic acid-binding Zn ribbon protein